MKSRFIAAMDLLQEEASRGDLTLHRIFQLLGEEGHAMLMLFLCLPFMQPIPIPGLSTPLGLLVAIVAFFLYLNRPPWLPKKFENLKISSDVLLKVSELAEKIWKHASKIIKQRMIFLHDHWFFRILNLIVVVVNAFLLALPLPIPFSNTVPVIAIVLSAIGYMEKDGVFILFSYLWCLIVASFFATLTMGAIHFT
ncbi:exopolysaccharide biosynthesis protein [uncultured Bdellovibrio sp.]|uniref:exopolysaccharide biosynthesis protein n=1 Tax=Bdellovibrio sp. HCB-162 TaxID=3394234 RepID=UPI0025E07BDE|nr:exopolysaccharide biosynthesis protein [uncultured Bdellovibrio sp.]